MISQWHGKLDRLHAVCSCFVSCSATEISRIAKSISLLVRRIRNSKTLTKLL